jgi:hypothetical protein
MAVQAFAHAWKCYGCLSVAARVHQTSVAYARLVLLALFDLDKNRCRRRPWHGSMVVVAVAQTHPSESPAVA